MGWAASSKAIQGIAAVGGWWMGGALSRSLETRELKQTDAAAANLQIPIQKDSRPSELSRPLTSITLNLNRDLPVDRRRISLLKLPTISTSSFLFL